MTSILKVSTIQDPTNSNTAISIDSAGKVTAGNLTSPGHVVQVVDASSTTVTSLINPTSGTWYAVQPPVTISPKFANSKIVIQHYAGGLAQDNASVGLRISRNGTVIYSNDRHGYTATQNDWVPVNWSSIWVDSPATTSAVTYSFEITSSSSGTAYLRHNDGQSASNTAFTIATEIAQ